MGAQLKTILGKRKVLIPTIAVATVLVLAFLIFVSRSNKTAEAAPRPIDVQVVKVEQKDVPVYNESIGTTAGMVNADIRLRCHRGSDNSWRDPQCHLERQLLGTMGDALVGRWSRQGTEEARGFSPCHADQSPGLWRQLARYDGPRRDCRG